MIQQTNQTPTSSADTTSDYLIVGGGMAAHAAATAILEEQPGADLLILSEDDQLPYVRPALSKDLLVDSETTPADVTHTDPYGDKVDIRLGTRVVDADASAHTVRDHKNGVHRYGKLLLATGGIPRQLPGGDDARIIHYRSMADFRRLEEHIALNHRIAVVGAGFIGMEIAAALAQHSCEAVWILPGNGPGSGMFPDGLVGFLADAYRARGVELVPGQRVTDVDTSGDTLYLQTDGGGRHAADCAVVGIGVIPADGLAGALGIPTDDGIEVDTAMRTCVEDVFAAGDIVRVHRREQGRAVRVEHEDNALKTGEAAGRAMTGKDVVCDQTPIFIPTCSTLATRPWGNSTPASSWSRTGWTASARG